MKNSNNNFKAFTLVELLVVISIIALLLAILMPSLSKARELAKSVVCKAHLKSFGTALAVYDSTYDSWLPGPNTSGKKLTETNTAPDVSSPTTPVQNMDWISPILGEELSLSRDRSKRLTEILNHKLKCPSVKDKYDFVYGGGWDVDFVQNLYVSSYSASLAFHVKSYRSNSSGKITDQAMSFLANVPNGYAPKSTNIGKPVEKVFVMDGTRYVDRVNNGYEVSFNGFAKQIQGGNYMTYGPPTTFSGDPFKFNNFRAPEIMSGTEKYAYRHSTKINVIYFDGHAETLNLEKSLNMKLYWPKGSKVITSAGTWDPSDKNGDIIY